jgi:hypothetical protein
MTDRLRQIGNEAMLASVRQEYKNNPPTPELVNKTWKTPWKIWGEDLGYDFLVPNCDRNTEELIQLRKEKREVLLIPDILYSQEGQPLLVKMFPDEDNWPIRKDIIISEESKGGCIDIEIDGKYYQTYQVNINETQSKRVPQRQTTFVVGSKFNKFLYDRYFQRDRALFIRPGGFTDGLELDANNNFYWVSGIRRSEYVPRSEGRRKS